MAEKARLRRSGKEVVDAAENAELLMPGAEDIVDVRVPTWGEIIIGWLRPTLLFALLTALLLLILYVGSSATNIFFTSVGNGQSLIVARGTFVGNVATPGSRVLASTSTPDSRTFLNNIKVGFLGVPDAVVVKIRSGLYDQLSLDGSKLLVNGEVVGEAGSITLANGSKARLSRQYVAECVSGKCGAKGNLLLIEQQNVYGEVKRD